MTPQPSPPPTVAAAVTSRIILIGAKVCLINAQSKMRSYLQSLPNGGRSPQAAQAVMIMGLIDQLQDSVQSLAAQEVSTTQARPAQSAPHASSTTPVSPATTLTAAILADLPLAEKAMGDAELVDGEKRCFGVRRIVLRDGNGGAWVTVEGEERRDVYGDDGFVCDENVAPATLDLGFVDDRDLRAGQWYDMLALALEAENGRDWKLGALGDFEAVVSA